MGLCIFDSGDVEKHTAGVKQDHDNRQDTKPSPSFRLAGKPHLPEPEAHSRRHEGKDVDAAKAGIGQKR